MTALPAELRAWAHDVADRFRKHQRRDPISVTRNGRVVQPEEQCVEYVLQILTEGGCPATAQVLEEIDRIRASTPEVAA